MQKRMISIVVAVVVLFAVVLNSNTFIKVKAEDTEVNQQIYAKFYLLKSGVARPESNGSLSSKNYTYAGVGKISIAEVVTKDDEKVKEHVIKAPNYSSMISEDEEVIWYEIKKESDGWHVDGEVVSKVQPVQAKFYLLKAGVTRPQGDEKIISANYRYVGNGKITTEEAISKDDEKIKEHIAEEPDCTSYISEGEEVIWYSVKKESDGWHVDGEIVEKLDTCVNIVTFDSLQELKEADVEVGDTVITTGYYSKDDGNGAEYEIVRSVEGKINDGTAVRLNNGYCAQMVLEDGMVSIGQFGAIGDGEFDNSEVLKRVFDTPIVSKIVFPKGEYKVTDSIYIHEINNCEIIGNDSVIFTDNDYVSTYGGTVLLRIENVQNLKIEGLNVEGRETEYKCAMQFVVNYAENFVMDNCTFTSPENVILDEEKTSLKYCTGSFRSGWKNIKVTNCTFSNLLDSNVGGLIGLNDYYFEGCSDLVFENNKCYYKGHDEMIAIFTTEKTSIQNITFKNNEFYAFDSDNHPRAFCFSIGYNDGYKVDNVVFEGNKFEVSSNYAFMYFGASSNVRIKDNNIIYKQITDTSLPIVFKADKITLEDNIIVDGNHITLENKDSDTSKIEAICYGEITFNNNIIDSYMYTYTMFRGNGVAENNIINLYKGARGIGTIVSSFSNNTVVFYQYFDYLFNLNGVTLSKDSIIDNNKIYCEFDENQKVKTLLYLSGTRLNNNKVTFNNNIVMEKEGGAKNRLYCIDINDIKAQEIEINNNKTVSYQGGVLKTDLSIHNITITNNN